MTEDPRIPKRIRRSFPGDGENRVGRPGRHRNQALDAGQENKWNRYRQLIKRAVASLSKEQHYEDLYQQARARTRMEAKDHELRKIQKKILMLKHTIVVTLQALENENADDRRWPELGEADEENMVDVGHVLCSRCNEAETEENDILLCDRALCFRAYHQHCLEPPIDLSHLNPDDDWCVAIVGIGDDDAPPRR